MTDTKLCTSCCYEEKIATTFALSERGKCDDCGQTAALNVFNGETRMLADASEGFAP